MVRGMGEDWGVEKRVVLRHCGKEDGSQGLARRTEREQGARWVLMLRGQRRLYCNEWQKHQSEHDPVSIKNAPPI